MSISAAQARAALEEVMQYAEEGIHYDDDGEHRLLTERVPSYFDVRVNIRASIAANGEKSLRARMLLARFSEAHNLRVDNSADTSTYSFRKVVGWMSTKGMSDEEDVDMIKQLKGGTYTLADFKQMLMTQAKKWGMLVEDSKDEMKSGAAEILLLSCLKDIPQAPPQDFQYLPVIIANGVEYVLLDQLVDFMKKKPDDRNVIHEALHDVTEQALAGKDLINYRVRSVDEDVICGTPLWDGIFMAALYRLSIAASEVNRKRSREEGWKLVTREADVAFHAADGHTSAGEEIVRTVSIVRFPINTMSTEEVEEEDVFNEWTMSEQQRERGFEDSSLPIDFEYDIEETRVRNNEKDARAPSYEVEVSGNDVSSNEEGEEYDAYKDMEVGGGQASKGWAHAILRLARVFSNPHLLLRVVMKEATSEGAVQYASLTSIMRSYSNGKRWSLSKDDSDVIADFSNCRRSQTLETQVAANCFNNGDNDISRAAETRMSELNMHKHVQENGLWGFYRGPHGDDPQLDSHLALQPDRMHTIEHDIFLHMIDAFKAAAYKKLPDIAQTEILHEMDARLKSISERCVRTYPQLVLPVATGFTEDNDDQKRPVAIVMDSFQQSGRQKWKTLRTFLWYEYLNEADKAGVLTPETVDTSWVTCRDLLGSNIVYAECSQPTNTSDCGVYVCYVAAELMRKLANVTKGTNITAKCITEVVSAMEINERTVEKFRQSMVQRFVQCAAMAKLYNTAAACDTENVFRDLIDGTRSGSS
ncbi:hypothetical protein CBR_g36812 [Chara braunii]|uniref:Ubiquitin-like protease family profile domain-containing protein n=1 Tax=Chara braunii TaxID=69332 RepID=A0A388LLJ7_CHABU|nr:hypothetical protein CBR_g36812 [Chara braunii]|eukprot:GBG83198.1 hypothetical protein CBR_g36812 [Chara braunii]